MIRTRTAERGFNYYVKHASVLIRRWTKRRGMAIEEYREKKARHQQLMRRWRGIARCVAPLCDAQAEAAARVYAPHGAGYKRCRDEFEALSFPGTLGAHVVGTFLVKLTGAPI